MRKVDSICVSYMLYNWLGFIIFIDFKKYLKIIVIFLKKEN